MGILHSTTRFLGSKPENEEDLAMPINFPHPSSRQNRYNLSQILTFHNLIYKSVKGLLQKLRFKSNFKWPMENTGPILPIQNPLLAKTLVIPDPNTDDIKGKSLACTNASEENICSAVFIEESDIPQDATLLENRDEEKVVITKRDSRKNTDPILPIQNPSLAAQTLVISDPNNNDDVKQKSVACTNWIMCSQSSADHFVEKSENAPFMEGEKEEKVAIIKSILVVSEGRWIKHYSTRHRILLVGEGDFSFSASLALAFGMASNMIATSHDSKAFLKKNYQNAPFNIMELRNRECKVMHGIDATKMASHALLGQLKFDRIIFNFPFAGFFKNLSREAQLRRHRRLVSLFMKNAREMISENGEIHISHKTNVFHVEWKLESVASSHRLKLIEAVKFNHLDYPGYNTKCGFGGDNNFNCNPSKTYKFGLKTVRY